MNDRVPRWYRLAWFLGRAPNLTTHQWKVLGLVSAVSIFEQYDVYLFALNLRQIQADLGIAESQVGLLGAVVRAGAFLSVFLAIAADRWGRKVLLLTTVVGYTVFTGATAFAPNAETFIVCQFFARGFAAAEVMIAVVVIAEEFPPEHRGWGIGALAALQAVGAGMASLFYGFVDVIPFGWRTLYFIGLFPLVLIMYWRRTLPETKRFESISLVRVREPLFRPLINLLVLSPQRVVALFSVVFAFSLAASAAGFFAPKYLQDVHEWTPASIAVLSFFGGALAIIGNPLAGWLSDRFGRKPVTAIFTLAFMFVTMTFYSAIGLFIPFLWIGFVFFVMGSDVTLSSYSTELFPTKYRSTAMGFRGFVGTTASIIGLTAISALYLVFGSNWIAITVLCGFSLVVPIVVWLYLPETAGKTLEEISPDD